MSTRRSHSSVAKLDFPKIQYIIIMQCKLLFCNNVFDVNGFIRFNNNNNINRYTIKFLSNHFHAALQRSVPAPFLFIIHDILKAQYKTLLYCVPGKIS